MPLYWSVAYTVIIKKLVVSNFNQGMDNLVWLTFKAQVASGRKLGWSGIHLLDKGTAGVNEGHMEMSLGL